MQVQEFTEEKNDEAHERLLAHLRSKRSRGQMTANQSLAAINATYEAFDKHNTPEQTWNILCAQAKRHGLVLEGQA